MAPKRVALNKIKSLTFESGVQTEARRTDPIPQLQCHGKACRRYQPDIVQCQNMGDDGSGSIQWKCDADLPQGMRFGRVEVSCEGWTRAGDTNVLSGSCGLTYDLTTIDSSLESDYGYQGRTRSEDIISTVAQIIAVLTTAWVAFNILRNLFNWFSRRNTPGQGHGGGAGGGGGGPDGGPGGGGPGFGGGAPPPPYTKQPPTDTDPSPSYPPGTIPHQQQQQGGPGAGFWTGLAAGGAATYLFNRGRDQPGLTLREDDRRARGRGRVDWEDMDRDRGVGPSTGGGDGGMRRATAFGSSSTR